MCAGGHAFVRSFQTRRLTTNRPSSRANRTGNPPRSGHRNPLRHVRSVTKNRIFAAAILVAATAVASGPAYSTGVYHPPAPPPKVHKSPPGSSSTGKIIVGCIMGSLGAIGSALRVSRTENRELTQDEAWTALSFCGLGAFALAVRPVQAKPQRVVARY